MGALDDGKLQKRDEQRQKYFNRQDQSNSNRLSGLRARASRRKMAWSLVPAHHIGELVHRAGEWGAALLFGLTRDGGALTITVYLDGDKEVLYINDVDMVEDTLNDVWNLFPERAHGADAVGEDIPF